MSSRGQNRWYRGGVRQAVVGSLALSVVLVVAFAAGASAGGEDTPAGVAHRLAQVERQQAIEDAKQAITERQAYYGLLFNGDGPTGPDRKKWGDEIFAPESPFIAYDPELNLLPAQTFPSRQGLIDMEVARQPKVWPNTANLNGSMHYMFEPFFDEVTPTTAKTRTLAMIVSAVKGTRTVNTITICVYHDTWKKTADGWRKTESKWYRIS